MHAGHDEEPQTIDLRKSSTQLNARSQSQPRSMKSNTQVMKKGSTSKMEKKPPLSIAKKKSSTSKNFVSKIDKAEQ